MARNASIALLAPLLLAALAAPCRAQTGALPPEEPGIPPGFTPLSGAEAQAVRAALQGYAAAVRSRDGSAAARAVSRDTRAYYAQMRDLAMTAPEAQVKALPLMDRISVLMYRHRVPADVLRTLTGDAAFAHTISDGWVAETSQWEPSATSEVFVNGDRAIVKESGQQIQLLREEGAWRWDMMPFIRTASTQFTRNLPAGMTEDDFVLLVLSTSTGRPASPSVWQPVQ